MLQPHMLLSIVLLVAGMALVLWGAERFTDGAIRTAIRFALSPFFVGAVVSGFEPENLITGAAAAVGGLPQVALGTVIGAAVFMLTGGLGLALLLVPMEVNIPRAGGVAMLLCLLPGIYLAIGYMFTVALVIDKKMEFWTAMEVSRQVVHQHWWLVFGFSLVCLLVNFAGILACFIGVIVSAPLTMVATMYLYEDLFSVSENREVRS